MIDDFSGHRERIKNRFQNSTDISEIDMLELLLSYGIPRKNTNLIAKNLMRKYDNLLHILTNIDDIDELYVKDHCKILLKLVQKISIHTSKAKIKNLTIINNTHEIVPVFRQMISSKNVEELYAVFLNVNREIIRYELLSIGTFNCVYTYPREIIKKILNTHAAFLILVHNHPSGNPKPSSADIEFTISLRNILKLIGVGLIDHIIITQSSYISFIQINIL